MADSATDIPRSSAEQRQMGFTEMLRQRWQTSGSLVCVGLDPELDRIPQAAHGEQRGDDETDADIERTLVGFTQAIVDATAEMVCAFKPNSAFYEQYGPAGIRALQRLIAYIGDRYPDIPVILDAKRGDIGSTSAAYARFAFDAMRANAVTLHPYLGREALDPFLQRADRGSLILCRTSNPGAGEFQDLALRDSSGGDRPLYQRVAHAVATEWNSHGNCALVVGATYPEELHSVREIVGDLPILVPGIGAQGGDLDGVVRNGLDANGDGLMISLSRSVLYASTGADFADAARREAERVMRAINDLRK